MKQDYTEMTTTTQTVSELKDFVKKLNSLPEMTRHINLAQHLSTFTSKASFLGQLDIEHTIVEGQSYDICFEYIEEMIHKQEPILRVLRLLVLFSITNSGLTKKHFDYLRREILHSYGFEHMLTLCNLEKAGLFKKQDSKSNWSTIKHALKLVVEDDTANPKDISYVFSGYAPLSIRLVQHAVRSGWRSIEEILKLLPGPHSEFKRGGYPSISSSETLHAVPGNIDRASDGPRSLVLVVFIGGVTFAEISALRFLRAQVMEISFEDGLQGDSSRLTPRQRQLFYTRMREVVVVIETEYESPEPEPPIRYVSSYVCKEDKGAPNNSKFVTGGGGVINSKGLILTCAHISPEKSRLITIWHVDEDLFSEAKIEHVDRSSELCLLSVIDEGIFDFAKFGNDIYVGMEVASLCHSHKLVYSLTIGEVAFECVDGDGDGDETSVGKYESAVAKTPEYRKVGNVIDPEVDVGLTDFDPQLPIIQINNLHGGSGTSGAPIFDSRGRVIGITSFILKGFDFAVHLSRCTKNFQDYLAAERNKKRKRNKKRNEKRKFDNDKRNKKRKFDNDKRKKGGKISNSGHQMDLVP